MSGRVLVLCVALFLAGCGTSNIVNTGEPHTPVGTTTAAPSLPAYDSNDHLANANEFYAGDRKAYFFTTPSGRWHCGILPHVQAGCAATGSGPLPIAGVEGSPNALVIDRSTEPQFVVLQDDPFGVHPGPATTLPFGTVLVVAGFRCNVQEATGVSCGSESSGKGFTFSTDGYTPTYTDIP